MEMSPADLDWTCCRPVSTTFILFTQIYGKSRAIKSRLTWLNRRGRYCILQ